jgi:hypothetical protein
LGIPTWAVEVSILPSGLLVHVFSPDVSVEVDLIQHGNQHVAHLPERAGAVGKSRLAIRHELVEHSFRHSLVGPVVHKPGIRERLQSAAAQI